jgi:hypothetical protein
MATPLRSHRLRNPHTYFMKHVRLVSWFISCSPTQSLYPGRPRGGLTVFPSRHLSPDADLRNPEGLLCTCAPPRARSSCPTVPLSELPDPHLRMVEDFVSLARPLATALWPRPSSSSPTTFKRDGGPFQFLICVRGVVEMVCSLCDWPWV